jgi:hypothetical protein
MRLFEGASKAAVESVALLAIHLHQNQVKECIPTIQENHALHEGFPFYTSQNCIVEIVSQEEEHPGTGPTGFSLVIELFTVETCLPTDLDCLAFSSTGV